MPALPVNFFIFLSFFNFFSFFTFFYFFSFFSTFIAPSHAQQLLQPPIFSPCQFPVPEETEFFAHICQPHRELPFLCDLHRQLDPTDTEAIVGAFRKHRPVFRVNGTDLLGVAVVRQLAQPISMELLQPESPEFGCLFATPCLKLTRTHLGKFVNNFKFFTKVYTQALFRRWFRDETCSRPRILALVLTDGIVFDPRKLTMVVFHTDDARLKPFLANIQLEIANIILRGSSLEEALSELLDQVGFALREYHVTGGVPRHHGIPAWAFQVTLVSVALVVAAMIVEWCIVRRKLIGNRSHSGLPSAAGRSKTHLIF